MHQARTLRVAASFIALASCASNGTSRSTVTVIAPTHEAAPNTPALDASAIATDAYEGEVGAAPVATTLAVPLDESPSSAPPQPASTRQVSMRTAPSLGRVVVHVPRGFDASRPIRLAIFFHGFYSCALQEISSEPVHCRTWYGAGRLGDLADAAGQNTILVGPQFATGCPPGSFATRDGFRAFVDELLGESLRDVFGGPRSYADVESITLLVSSGGFRPAATVLTRGGVRDRIRTIALLDALYGGDAIYLDWLAEARESEHVRRLFVAYTDSGTPRRTVDSFLGHARRRFGDDVERDPSSVESSMQSHRVVIARSRAAHNVLTQTYVRDVLRGSAAGELDHVR